MSQNLKPRVIISTDLSVGESDWDDWEAVGFALLHQEYYDIEQIIICSTKPQNNIALAMSEFDSVIVDAYNEAYPALSDMDSSYVATIPYMASSLNGIGFRDQDIDISNYPSIAATINAISSGDILYYHWWGSGSEAATVARWVERNRPDLIPNIYFISHAAHISTMNNYRRDQAAAQWMEAFGDRHDTYFSLGFSGKVIDGRHSHPSVTIDDKGLKIGKLLKYKKFPSHDLERCQEIYPTSIRIYDTK